MSSGDQNTRPPEADDEVLTHDAELEESDDAVEADEDDDDDILGRELKDPDLDITKAARQNGASITAAGVETLPVLDLTDEAAADETSEPAPEGDEPVESTEEDGQDGALEVDASLPHPPLTEPVTATPEAPEDRDEGFPVPEADSVEGSDPEAPSSGMLAAGAPAAEDSAESLVEEAGEISPGEGTPPALQLLSRGTDPARGLVEQEFNPATGEITTTLQNGPIRSITYRPGQTPPYAVTFAPDVPESQQEQLIADIEEGRLAAIEANGIRRFPDGRVEVTPQAGPFARITLRPDASGRLVVDRDESATRLREGETGDRDALIQQVERGDLPFHTRREGNATRQEYLDGRVVTTYSPAGPGGLHRETVTPPSPGQPETVTVREYGQPTRLTETERVSQDGRTNTETTIVEPNGLTITQRRNADGSVTTTISHPTNPQAVAARPWDRAEHRFNPETGRYETTFFRGDDPVEVPGGANQAIGTRPGENGTTYTYRADGRIQQTGFPESDPRRSVTVFPPGDRLGRVSDTVFDAARNGGVARETVTVGEDGSRTVIREFQPPRDGVTRRSEIMREGQERPEVISEGQEPGGRRFTRREWDGPAEKGRISQTQYEDGTVETTFERGRISRAVFAPGQSPQFFDRSTPPQAITEPPVTDEELVVAQEEVDGRQQITYADGRVVTDMGDGTRQTRFPRSDSLGRITQTEYLEEGRLVTQYADRTETQLLDGFDRSTLQVNGLEPDDPRLAAVTRIIEYTSGDRQGQIRLEYDPLQLDEESADLTARIIFPEQGDGVVEEREYDGSRGRTRERDVFRDGELLHTEGEGIERRDEQDVPYSFRRWQDQDGQQVEQRYFQDGSIRTDFAAAVPGTLSEHYSSIIWRPGSPPEVLGLSRDGQPPEFAPVPADRYQFYGDGQPGLVSQDIADDGTIVSRYLNGTIITERPQPGEGEPLSTTEFPPNDQQQLSQVQVFSDRTATLYTDGRTEIVYNNPAPGALAREIRYPQGDEQNRIAERHFAPGTPGGPLSETEYRGENGERLIIRQMEGGRQEREIVDSQGRRISVERTGEDENGTYQERVRDGLTERRWENGRFRITNAQGEVIAEGSRRPFQSGGQSGFVEVDERTGRVMSVRFTEGPRAGESYSFTYGADGKVSSVTFRHAGGEGQPPQEVTITRSGPGGAWQPPGVQVPGFSRPGEGQALSGEFTVRDNGDIIFNQGNGIREVLRANGQRERVNFNDYSREVTPPGGGEPVTEYWDGFGWRRPSRVETVDGRTVVHFEPMQGRPSRIERDHTRDTLVVHYADGSRWNANWREQTQTYTNRQGQSRTFANTGEIDPATQKPIWREIQPNSRRDLGNGSIEYTLNHNEPALPARVVVNTRDGSITSIYRNGTTVSRDARGRTREIAYANGRRWSFDRHPETGDLLGITAPDGTRYTPRGDDAPGENDGQRVPRWNVLRPGQPPGAEPEIFAGTITLQQNGSVEIRSTEGTRTVSEANGRITTSEGGRITSITDRQGQVWTPQGEPDAQGNQTWRVEGDQRAVFTGRLRNLDDGRVAVETAQGLVTRNADRSQSVLNERGVELERRWDNGRYLLRHDDGRLRETFDGQERRTFEWGQDAQGRPVITRVTATGADGQARVVEAMFQGQLRELREGAQPNSTRAEDFGRVVSYEPSGNRVAVQQDGDRHITITDLHGSTTVLSADGQSVVRAVVRNPVDNSVREFEGNLLMRTTDHNGVVREFRWGTPPGQYPATIVETRPGQPSQTLTLVPEQQAAGIYRTPEGDRARFLRHNASMAYEVKEGEQTVGWRIETLGGEVMRTGTNPNDIASVSEDGNLTRIFLSNGETLEFVRQEGRLLRVDQVSHGPPPRRTTLDAADEDGRLRPADDPVSETVYNPQTGSRTVTTRNEDGEVTGSVETLRDGTKVHRDAANRITERENADGSRDIFEGGQLHRRENPDGSRLFFDAATGEVVRTVDAGGLERHFTWSGSGNNRRITQVAIRQEGSAGEAQVVERLDTGGRLRVIVDGQPTGDEVRYDALGETATGARLQVRSLQFGVPENYTRTRLDGTETTVSDGIVSERNMYHDRTESGGYELSPNQRLQAIGLVNALVAAGNIDEALRERFRTLLAGAETPATAQQLIGYLQDQLARRSDLRLSIAIRPGEGGAPPTFIPSIRRLSAATN